MKAKQDITIIQIQDATQSDLAMFKESFEVANKSNTPTIFMNHNVSVFKIRKGEIFKVVNKEVKIGKINKEMEIL